MIDLFRLGLGCMGMSCYRNPENSLNTVRYALDNGLRLLNTGEFYSAGESEMIVGKALKGVNRDDYFLSVKFGVLPAPKGGIYGLDVNPFNVKGHLTYSLRRLGLEYVDLYQPARMDTAIPVEDVVGAIADEVKAGYVKKIGLSMVDAETLRRACKVHHIDTVEVEYSLIERGIEKELISTAKELGVKVLAFGTVGHGLFTDDVLTKISQNHYAGRGALLQDNLEETVSLIKKVQNIAESKGCTLSQLAILWSLSKYDNVQSLVGTTNPAHLQSAIDALKFELTEEDIKNLEETISPDKIKGRGMRNFRFTNGVPTIL